MATVGDARQLAELLCEYLGETGWARYLTFDKDRAWKSISNGIKSDASPFILAMDRDGDIVGFLSFGIDHTFSTRPFINLHEVWARQDYRKTGLGRKLFASLIDIARYEGAAAIHASIASGVAAAKTLKNLMAKAGFEEAGYAMRKVF